MHLDAGNAENLDGFMCGGYGVALDAINGVRLVDQRAAGDEWKIGIIDRSAEIGWINNRIIRSASEQTAELLPGHKLVLTRLQRYLQRGLRVLVALPTLSGVGDVIAIAQRQRVSALRARPTRIERIQRGSAARVLLGFFGVGPCCR